MTCIVGLEHDGEVWIGGDSATTTNNDDVFTRATPKIFRKGPLLIGCSGSARVAEIVQFALEVPRRRDKNREPESDRAFLAIGVADAIRGALHANGVNVAVDGFASISGNMIVGYRGRVYVVRNDLEFGRREDSYATIGSGDDFALGAMHATENDDAGAAFRITKALRAASYFRTDVRGPFAIIRQRANGQCDTMTVGG